MLNSQQCGTDSLSLSFDAVRDFGMSLESWGWTTSVIADGPFEVLQCVYLQRTQPLPVVSYVFGLFLEVSGL